MAKKIRFFVQESWFVILLYQLYGVLGVEWAEEKVKSKSECTQNVPDP